MPQRPHDALALLLVRPQMETVVHVFLVAWIAGLSLVFFWPGTTLTLPAFMAFGQVGSNRGWAWGMAVIAAWTGLGLWTRRRHCILTSLAMVATTHGVVALCFFYSGTTGLPVPLSGPTHGLISVLGYYTFWRKVWSA